MSLVDPFGRTRMSYAPRAFASTSWVTSSRCRSTVPVRTTNDDTARIEASSVGTVRLSRPLSSPKE